VKGETREGRGNEGGENNYLPDLPGVSPGRSGTGKHVQHAAGKRLPTLARKFCCCGYRKRGKIERVGGQRAIPLDIRVIAATHRKEDIPVLTLHFIDKKSQEMGIKNRPAIAAGALDRLSRYNWPGNVRELENLVDRELIPRREGLLHFYTLPDNTGETRMPQAKAHLEETSIETTPPAEIMQVELGG